MKIVVDQRLILTHAFNCRLVGYVLVVPLHPDYCICYYQTPSNYLNVFELAHVIDWHMKCDDKPMWEEPNDHTLQQVSLSIFYKSNNALIKGIADRKPLYQTEFNFFHFSNLVN